MPNHVDSVEKIIQRYFSAVSVNPFQFKGIEYRPKGLRVSCGIFFKKMECVVDCGACCPKFSLDWIPSEKRPETDQIQKREIEFNGKLFAIWSDLQIDNEGYHCRNLRAEDARCGIHGVHPFSCDFELLRFSHFEDPNSLELLNHRPFGRAWQMKKLDGERGALCEWTEEFCDSKQIQMIKRKLLRLQDWTDYFGLETLLPRIIQWVERGPHTKPLALSLKPKRGFDV